MQLEYWNKLENNLQCGKFDLRRSCDVGVSYILRKMEFRFRSVESSIVHWCLRDGPIALGGAQSPSLEAVADPPCVDLVNGEPGNSGISLFSQSKKSHSHSPRQLTCSQVSSNLNYDTNRTG